MFANNSGLLQGTLELLVLKTLSWGPMHGFEITSWLERQSGGRLGFTDAALLQALHRLEAQKFLVASWGETEKGRTARYYEMTAAGRRHYRAESEALLENVRAMIAVLGVANAGR